MKTVELLTKAGVEELKLNQNSELKMVDMAIKASIGENKYNMDIEKIRSKALEKSADIDKDKQLKLVDIVSDLMKDKSNRKGE